MSDTRDAPNIKKMFAAIKNCFLFAACDWFTFYSDLSYCQMFSNCTVLDTESCPDCVTGEVSISSPIEICIENDMNHRYQKG